MTAIRLFISHASDEAALAQRVVELVRAALGLHSDEIRCTSLEGHRLPGGVSTDEQLRRDVRDAEAFVGLVSRGSLRSLYVLFELGARWGAGRPLIPLLTPGTPSSVLGGPLAALNALRADRPSQLHQLVAELGAALSLPVAKAAIVQQYCEAVAGGGPPGDTTPGAASNPHRWRLPVGAEPDDTGTRFRVWAPVRKQVDVVVRSDRDGSLSTHPLLRGPDGYFEAHVENVVPGDTYQYQLDGGQAFPDPASRHQPGPEGVHGASEVVDHGAFFWTDQEWCGIALDDLVIYEVHVGTATKEGTFDALITRLGAIRELGATAIMLMAVADFAGDRNWGYDGVALFAPARVYGGPEGLRRLVDAAHARQLAVIIDVVFNHVGPDGSYLDKFSPWYFSDKYQTPWGRAFNYQQKTGRPVCELVVANACYWFAEYHADGLRLDAIQAIQDDEEPNIIGKVTSGVRRHLPEGRHFLVIAEDENNDPQAVRPVSPDGYGLGLDAIYADDFHHQVHVALTNERMRYYQDYSGSAADLATTITEGWFFAGQTSQWRCDDRGRPRDIGHPVGDTSPEHLIWCIQNHDQIGNRPLGQRLNHLVGPSEYRAASALLLLSPYTPLLFMGQEWAASTPFLYFTDHEEELGARVTEGRLESARSFPEFEPARMPRPQDERTFLDSKLRWEERSRPPHAGTLRLYKDLLALRRDHPALRHRARGAFHAVPMGGHALALVRQGTSAGTVLLVIVNLKGRLPSVDLRTWPLLRVPGHLWQTLLDTEAVDYGGDGTARLESGARVDMRGPGALVLEARPT